MCNSRHVRNIPQVTKIIPAPFNAKAFNENRARKRQNRTPSRDRERGSEPRTPNLFPRHDQRRSKERTPGQGSTHRLSRVVLWLRSVKRKINPQGSARCYVLASRCPQSQGRIIRSLFETFLCRMSLSNYVARNCGCRLVGAPGSARASHTNNRSEKCRELFAVSYWLRSP